MASFLVNNPPQDDLAIQEFQGEGNSFKKEAKIKVEIELDWLPLEFQDKTFFGGFTKGSRNAALQTAIEWK